MDLRSMQFAHDLKMPIQLIYSCVQLLEMEISPNARAEGYLQMLLHSASQLQNMVRSALDAGCAKPGLQLRDVVQLARNVCRACALLAREKGLHIHFETNAARFVMPTDTEKLERILGNLISNALRFTPAGGHICLSVRVMGDSVEFAVADDGCGIADERRDEVFLPGVSDGGHGCGLTIVRNFARELGGDVQLESAPGKGSCFTVRLPVLRLA